MGTIRKPHHLQNRALMCSKSCLSAPNRNIWVIVRNLDVPVFWLKRMVCCSHVKDIICTHTAQLYSDDQSCTEQKAQKADTRRIHYFLQLGISLAMRICSLAKELLQLQPPMCAKTESSFKRSWNKTCDSSWFKKKKEKWKSGIVKGSAVLM